MNDKKIKELKNIWLSHLDKNGLYISKSDNPILFTIQCYVLLKKMGLFDEEDKNRLQNSLFAIARKIYDRVIFGLYNRRPGADERKDQHDNYTAIACTSYFGKEFQRYADEIDKYGKQFLWPSYDNRVPFKFSINPFWKPFLKGQFREALNYFECVRQGFDIFIYRCCANKYCWGICGQWYLWWIGSVLILLCKGKGNESSHLLEWITFAAIGHKWYIKPFYCLWKRKINKLYERGLLDIIKKYYLNPQYHPVPGIEEDIYTLALAAFERGIILE
jgi:hypothetical protein